MKRPSKLDPESYSEWQAQKFTEALFALVMSGVSIGIATLIFRLLAGV